MIVFIKNNIHENNIKFKMYHFIFHIVCPEIIFCVHKYALNKVIGNIDYEKLFVRSNN